MRERKRTDCREQRGPVRAEIRRSRITEKDSKEQSLGASRSITALLPLATQHFDHQIVNYLCPRHHYVNSSCLFCVSIEFYAIAQVILAF